MPSPASFTQVQRLLGACAAALFLNACAAPGATPTASTASDPRPGMSPTSRPAKPLFAPATAATPADAALTATRAKEVVRARPVSIDLKLLSAYAGTGEQSGQTVTLNLFDDVSFVAQSDSIERTARGFTWIGRLKGVDLSQVVIVATDGVVSGNITMPQARYHIRFAGPGVHEVQQIDTTRFKND